MSHPRLSQKLRCEPALRLLFSDSRLASVEEDHGEEQHVLLEKEQALQQRIHLPRVLLRELLRVVTLAGDGLGLVDHAVEHARARAS